MADNSTTNSSMYTIVNVDGNKQPTTVKSVNLAALPSTPGGQVLTLNADNTTSWLPGGGGGGGTVFGSFNLAWSISGGAWFNYPTNSTFTTALANAQTSTGQPTYSLTGYGGAAMTGNTSVPTTTAQALDIPTYTASLPVTISLTVTATMNNSDLTTTSVQKTATATYYVPILYALTANASNPNLSTSSSALTSQFSFGQIVTQTVTAPTQYFWIGVPNMAASNFAVTGQFPVAISPDATFTGQVISGQTYNVYGFTSLASQSQSIQVVS